MKTKIGLITVLAIAVAGSAVAVSGDWYVNAVTGNDGFNCTTPLTPCKTINAAIGKAPPLSTIHVAAGTYNEQVSIPKTLKSLTLLGAQAGEDARKRVGPESIIDNSCGPVQIHADDVTLDGFTIQGSTQSDPCFIAGVWVNPSYDGGHGGAQILNNIVQNNISGIELDNDGVYQTVVQSNLIRNNNNAGPGTGIGIASTVHLQNAVIDSNTFSGHLRGSIVLQNTGSYPVTISSNTLDAVIVLIGSSDVWIKDNASLGAGILLMDSSGVDITGNTSIGNAVDGTIYLGGGNSYVRILGNTLVNGVEAIVVDNSYAIDPNSSVTANFNCISGNSKNGLRVATGTYTGGLDARENSWGATSGPSGTGPGTGDRITDPDGVVDFSDFAPPGDSCPPRGAPAEATSISVTCDPGSVAIGVATTCTATVTNTSLTQLYGPPHGMAKFALGAGPKGTFSPAASCSLIPMRGTPAFSQCSVTFTATSGPGTARVHAGYTSSDGPSWKNAGNSPDFLLTVTNDSTKVSVSCTPNSVRVGDKTTCVATVTDTSPAPNNGPPRGTSTFSLGAGVTGTFSDNLCTLSPASSTTSQCGVTFVPTSGAGKARIRASYASSIPWEWADAGNSPDFNLTVTVDSTKVSVVCSPTSVRYDEPTTCTATVTDTATLPLGNPVGTANFSLGPGATGTLSANSCGLAPADSIISSCTVTFTPTSTGKAKIRASYDSGDLTKWADAGNSPDFSVTVPVDSTSASVSCSGPGQVGQPTTCTVTVTDTVTPTNYGSPVGTSKFSVGGVTETFSTPNPCILVPATSSTSTCDMTFTPTSAGTAKIHANYTSTDSKWANAPNSPDFSLTVTPAP